MGANRQLSELVNRGLRPSDLGDEFPERLDGVSWLNSHDWKIFAGTGSFTLARTAAGDLRANRTAGGAETHQLVYAPKDLITRRRDAKGVKVIGFAIAYIVGVVGLTTLTLRPNLTTYADAAAPSVAAYGGTQTFDAAHDTDAERKAVGTHLMEFLFADPKYIRAANAPAVMEHALFTMELEIVMANTGTFALLGGGALVAHDYV